MKKCLSYSLVVLIFWAAAALSTIGQTNDAAAEKVKRDVQLRGPGSKVVVTMKNGMKLQGSISQILDDSFDLKDASTGQPTTVPYTDVVKVKKPGFSKTKLALIGVGAGVVVLAVIVNAKPGRGSFCPLGCGPF